MINKDELKQYYSATGFNLGQAEWDYMQHLFLYLLSKNDSKNLIFKGGTALQKVYGLNRFSVDLDFTQIEHSNLDILMEKIVDGMKNFGYQTKIEDIKSFGKTFIIRIHGPLYASTPMTTCALKIEISQREKIFLQPQIMQVTPIYKDLQPYNILVMQLEEIFAEKIRAILTRNKPRDVFDLHFLLKKKAKFNKELINKKLEYYKVQFDKKIFTEKLKEKKSIWDKEMKNYVINVPNFEIICKEIIESIYQ